MLRSGDESSVMRDDEDPIPAHEVGYGMAMAVNYRLDEITPGSRLYA